MKKLLIIVVLVLFGVSSVYAQGELNEQQKVFFRNEKSFAIILNSDGIGFSYRGAKRIDFRNKNLFEIELGTLKHPKEYKISNPYTPGGNFVFGKLNSTFYLRGGIGHQHELYKKADLGGIAIRYFLFCRSSTGHLQTNLLQSIISCFANEYDNQGGEIRLLHCHASGYLWQSSIHKRLNEIKVMPGFICQRWIQF